ncbi:MAG: hypothetical protein JSV04_08955 [Candidatus Heimdallarchaeota archaeon]|nr:MAG: hypothetical protein JSV04_08955 [Candidatus Heimdallarchaeota archaeon]
MKNMNLHKRSLIIFLGILTGFIISSNSGSVNVLASTAVAPIIDGTISEDEYSSSTSFASGDYLFYWQIEGDTIYIGLIGKTEGWVAIGFEPTIAMKDADMIFGWVESNGTVITIDAFSTGNYGPHPADRDLGGSSDIASFDGSESSGSTTIEFSRLLTTGDQYDNTIPSTGTYNIIWAIGPGDDFGVKHTNRGSGIIDLTSGEPTTTTEKSTTTTEEPSEQSPGFEFLIVFLTLAGGLSVYRRKTR